MYHVVVFRWWIDMNKVYVVMMNCWEENILLGVFSTREKAASYIKNEYPAYKYYERHDYWSEDNNPDSIDITEVTVDE